MGLVHGQNAAGRPFVLPLNDAGDAVECEIDATLEVDTTGLATSAKQDTAQTSLTAILAAVDQLEGYLDTIEAKLAALAVPSTFTAITPSDSTDVTSACSKGVQVTVTGNVNLTGLGGSAVSWSTQVAGTVIYGSFSRVNAATTATVVGLS